MFFADLATVKGTHRTSDGYLSADARVSRTGIQIYTGAEVGRPELPEVRVYRSADEVFSPAAMASAAHKPITLDHPADGVDAGKWKQLAVGWTGGDVARDGEALRVPMIIADAAAIAAISSGKRELSCGYNCTLDWTPGVTPEGEAFSARQRGVKINHISIVKNGRAGSSCRFGDAQTPGFFTDENQRPRRLVDRDTGRGFTPDAVYLAAIQSQAAKSGMPLQSFVADVLRFDVE